MVDLDVSPLSFLFTVHRPRNTSPCMLILKKMIFYYHYSKNILARFRAFIGRADLRSCSSRRVLVAFLTRNKWRLIPILLQNDECHFTVAVYTFWNHNRSLMTFAIYPYCQISKQTRTCSPLIFKWTHFLNIRFSRFFLQSMHTKIISPKKLKSFRGKKRYVLYYHFNENFY